MSKAFKNLFDAQRDRHCQEEVKTHKRNLTLGILNSPARRIIIPSSRTLSKQKENDLSDNANPIYKTISFRSQKKFKWDCEKVDENEIGVYREVFQDIITQNKVYGGLLATVKAKYESFIDLMDGQTVRKENKLLIDKQKLKKERLVNDLKRAKVRESQYIELVRLLKAEGFPIDELHYEVIGSPIP